MARHSRAILVVSVSMVAAGACQRPPVSATRGPDGGDGSVTLPPCASFEARSVTTLVPDVLIVLDASGSMNNDINDAVCGNNDCGALSKWAQMTPGLVALVAANESTANWGLKMFADGDARCGVTNNVAVPVAKLNATPIAAAIAARTSASGGLVNGSRTPTRAAVTAATNYLGGLGDGNPKRILLLTDGTPNCGTGVDQAADDSPAAAQAVADARARGILTTVVGIATAGGPAEASLNAMAVAGGAPRAGATTAYYPVSNIAELESALTPIITMPTDCVLALPPAPAGTVAPRIGLRANGALIPFDTGHQDGWDWTDGSWASVRLYGAACDDYLAGRFATVTIEFYCPPD